MAEWTFRDIEAWAADDEPWKPVDPGAPVRLFSFGGIEIDTSAWPVIEGGPLWVDPDLWPPAEGD